MKLKTGVITYSNHSYISFDCDAGTARINVSTNEVIFNHNDSSIGEGNFSMGISHIHSNYSHLDETHMGLGWKLNIQHYLKKYDGSISLPNFTLNDYVYVDGEGYVHRFVKFDNKRYIDQSGHGMILTISNVNKIVMSNGNTLYFNSDGNLYMISIIGKTKNIIKHIEYEKGFIKKYYDTRSIGDRERYFAFEYRDGLLSKILLVSKGKVLETIYYKYSDGNLQGIYHFINNSLNSISLFKYDQNNIIFATGTSNGLALGLKYTNNTVKVKKGISKITKNAFNSLNDDIKVGEVYANDFLEPIIGVKETKTNYGSFIVGNQRDELLYLGDEIAFESLEDDLILNDDYENFELTNDEIFENTEFAYTSQNYTNILSGKNINYRYYYNKKGFVTSTFEVDEKNLMTLTKDSGIAISSTVSSSYSNERINNKMTLTRPINQGIICLDDKGDVEGFDGGLKLKYYRDDLGFNYVNYTASFWVKVTHTNASYMKVLLKIYHRIWISKEIYIDHTASGAWQYVTIPFTIMNDEQSKSYDFSSGIINVLSDATGSYDISNFRIEEGMHTKLHLTGHNLTYDSPAITEYYKVRLNLSDGSNKEIIFDHNNFITESDIFATCKNMQQNQIFDFVYCANTKIIPNVRNIYFRVLKDQDYTSYDNEYELYDIFSLNVSTRASDGSCSSTKKFTYDADGNLIELTYSEFGTETCNVLDAQGRLLCEVDSHNRKTVNEYDEYGNIISSTTSLSENFENDTKVIIGKPRFYTRYFYDDESNGGMYREMVVSTSFQDANVKVKKAPQMINTVESIQVGDNYAQHYSYDVLNRIKELSIKYDFGKFVRNYYEYDTLGRLKRVTDTTKYCYELDYDKYGNISRYYLKKSNGTLKAIKSKETIPNASSYGGDTQIETNHLTNSIITTENDKYGRPMKTIFNNNGNEKTILYEFQEHNASINSDYYQTSLNESPSISKIKKIEDGCDNSTTAFFYDNKNEDCGYVISRNGIEIQRIQQMDSTNTKYVIGSTKYKTSIEKENDIFDSRVNKTIVSWNKGKGDKDDWEDLNNYTFSYTYDDVLGIPISKTGSSISTVTNYIPSNNTTYYSNLVQNHLSIVGTKMYNYNYQYDSNQNIHRIISDRNGENDVTYSYDKLNRLKNEYIKKNGTNYTYSYLDENNNDINRVTKIISGTTKVKEFTYDELNRLTNYSKYGTIKTSLIYSGNNLNPLYISRNDELNVLVWTRDNLLTKYGNNSYNYNYQGNRVSKTTNTKTINYYYDGSKLLGEDHSDGVKIRYVYDLLGITGARYITSSGITDYIYVKDGQDNIVAISKDDKVVTEYYYDAWGNVLEEVKDSSDPFVKINPFRWRCNYYDLESELYYINGRYYSPELLSYISSLDIENVVSNSGTIGGLNPYSICTDNPTDLGSSDFTILTNTDFMPDPVYDPLVGYSWWDRNWKNVLRYGLFTLTFVISIVLMCIPGTQAFGIGMFKAGLGAALSGMVIGGVISGIISAVQGNDFFTGFADGAITGFVDGFTSGAILYCVSSAISAISKTIKASNQACAKPGQCFVAGTLVLTEYGYKNIEDIELGDKVWSWCEETGEKVINKVTTLFRNKTNDLVHLSIAGEELITTKGHPFYVVDYGWKDACELQLNDKVVMYNDTIVTVESIEIEHLTEETNVYNFEVENAHTYYVTEKSILVHNLCAEGRAIAKAKDAGIEVKYVDDLSGEFTDDAKKLIDSVSNKYNSPTVSDHVTGTKIHSGFMDKGGKIKGSSLKYDGFKNGTLYELKPYNARNIRKAVKQLATYKEELIKAGEKVSKLVLVLY